MIQTIKQNKKAVLAFLLALVMLIGLIPFAATEAHAMTVDATGDVVWEAGDSFTLHLVSKDNINATETHTITYDGTDWSTPKSNILPAYAFAYIGEVKDIAYSGGEWSYIPVLQLDQSDAEKLTNADVMIATGEASKEDPLDLHFKHYYAKVTYNVVLASEFNPATDTISRFDAVTCDGDYVNPYVDGNSYTAVIPANPYFKAGVHFALVTINGKKLEVEIPDEYANPNGSFVAGTHYTFDLKVGKDAVTIEQVSASSRDYPFSEGWRGDTETDLGADSITDTQDKGKTAWDDGDQIIATLTSQYYGEQTATLTYDGINWTHPEDMTFKYLENETPTVKAVYAPSNILGTGECIEFDCELNGGELTVKLESATRNYSRLRIIGLPNKTLTVYTTKFTPAGATSAATAPYTLTTDENGNAFLYGTFAEGATISVKQGDVVLKEYAFTANKHPGGTEQGKSYVLGAVPVIDLSQYSDGDTINITQDSVIVGDGNEYNISVNIAEDAIVTFDVGASGVKLGGQITVADGKTLTLLVAGDAEHTVNGGISLGNGSNVIIEGDLTKANNKLTVTATDGNAGIGANGGVTAGDITIRNARVDATGSSREAPSTPASISGAAIGTSDGSMGDILIENSIIVAEGGYYESTSHAAAIGIGYVGSTMGDIILKNSQITARNNGDALASVIGAGANMHVDVTGTLGDIVITNTELNLSMEIGTTHYYAALIGSGVGKSYAYVNMGKIIFTDMKQEELDEVIPTWLPSDFNQYGAYALGIGYEGIVYKCGTFGGVWVSDGNSGTVQIGDESGYYNPE